MRSGLAKIIGKVRISWYFECPEADVHKAENACGINYTNTWSLKLVYWLSESQSPYCSTSDYGCEDKLELYSGVARAHLPLRGLPPWVAPEPKIRWILATIHNWGWMDDCQVYHGCIEAISILDPLDVEEAYSHIALCYYYVKWHVRSHEQHDVSFRHEEDSMKEKLVFRCEVSSPEALIIQRRRDSEEGHASDFRPHPGFFQASAIF